MNPVKFIISCRKNLEFKYGTKFKQVDQLLRKFIPADKKKNIDTRIVYIDDPASAKKAGIKAVKHNTPKECKDAVDALFKAHIPVYIVLIGAGDVFPFQEIVNPAEDEDTLVPSDLPYACDAAYSKSINSFTGPTRVVGRIPDIPGQQKDITYIKKLVENSIRHKPIDPDKYRNYFSISAHVWRKSTGISLHNIFNDNKKLNVSPPSGVYKKANLQPLTHFINCHGALNATSFYGQKGNAYPDALKSSNLPKNIAYGTVVAAECCYGAGTFDSASLGLADISIANNYLGNDAVAFLGSSTIAYGPSDTNALADLITQYFIRNIINGSSSGRALLEARQLFLTESGPQLDPYELKTLAQFFLLGDPSVQPAIWDGDINSKAVTGGMTIQNNRLNLFNKGQSLKSSIMPAEKKAHKSKAVDVKQINKIKQAARFMKADKEVVYGIVKKGVKGKGLQKRLTGEDTQFRTFIQQGKKNHLHTTRVLVVKEDNQQVLGWRVYESR